MATSMDVVVSDERTLLDAFLDEHRRAAAGMLDGLGEEQVRERLVASDTTLLGLLKHLTFVEKVWFVEAITGVYRTELGLPADASESFLLAPEDTIDSIRDGYLAACDASRKAVASMGLGDIVSGNWRGEMTLRWIMVHCIRETAQHVGHAEILREQLLNR